MCLLVWIRSGNSLFRELLPAQWSLVIFSVCLRRKWRFNDKQFHLQAVLYYLSLSCHFILNDDSLGAVLLLYFWTSFSESMFDIWIIKEKFSSTFFLEFVWLSCEVTQSSILCSIKKTSFFWTFEMKKREFFSYYVFILCLK